MNVLVAGATGFIGGALVRRLLADGVEVRALVRDRARTRALPVGHPLLELHEGDVLDPASLEGAGDGIDVAYYLVHSMGRGGPGDFADRERRCADAFARMCSRRGCRSRDLPRRPRRRAGLQAPAQPRRDRAHPRRAWPAADVLPRRHGGRARQRVLPDTAPPRRAAAGDDHAALALHPDPADRHRRRDRLPRGGAARRAVRRARGPDRQPRRARLRRDARPHGAARSAGVRGPSCRCRCSRRGCRRCGSGW